jgi:Family of unknown function (DUF6194)
MESRDSAARLTEKDIIEFATGLPGVVAITASEGDGSPSVAWGDSFIYYDPDGAEANRRMPFATIVTKDYDGFDTASNLNRPGVFRLNIGVGRAAFQELVGKTPAHVDYTAFDRVLPHPVYATQGWVAILNPGEATAAQALRLLTDAHTRAARRHRSQG